MCVRAEAVISDYLLSYLGHWLRGGILISEETLSVYSTALVNWA